MGRWWKIDGDDDGDGTPTARSLNSVDVMSRVRGRRDMTGAVAGTPPSELPTPTMKGVAGTRSFFLRGCLVFSVWCLVFDVWCVLAFVLVLGVWCLVFGVLVFGVWCVLAFGLVVGVWFLANARVCKCPKV